MVLFRLRNSGQGSSWAYTLHTGLRTLNLCECTHIQTRVPSTRYDLGLSYFIQWNCFKFFSPLKEGSWLIIPEPISVRTTVAHVLCALYTVVPVPSKTAIIKRQLTHLQRRIPRRRFKGKGESALRLPALSKLVPTSIIIALIYFRTANTHAYLYLSLMKQIFDLANS